MLKGQNGVTLVALVVTIIVLIILAGVSIAMVIGDNGIIPNGQKAATDQKTASDKENKDMKNLIYYVEDSVNKVAQ